MQFVHKLLSSAKGHILDGILTERGFVFHELNCAYRMRPERKLNSDIVTITYLFHALDASLGSEKYMRTH